METKPRPEECVPTVPFEEEAEASFGSEAQILPGDYTIVAVSRIDGERASGAMRLNRSSPADSGRRSNMGEWVYVAPEDTISHPLYGVTTVDFTQTLVDTTASLDALARNVDPVYPQVLVGRRRSPSGLGFSWTLYVDTVRDRDSMPTLDGGGVELSVDRMETGFFGGWYYLGGIIGTDNGFYCAWQESMERSNPIRFDQRPDGAVPAVTDHDRVSMIEFDGSG